MPARIKTAVGGSGTDVTLTLSMSAPYALPAGERL